MKRALGLAALAAAFAVGCNKTPEGGPAPGTDNSFKLSLPTNTPATSVKQKEKKTVTVEVVRGKDFKQPVTLEVKAPNGSGLQAEVDRAKVQPGEDGKVTVTITAEEKAALGEHKISVTGKPDQGQPSTGEFSVKVEGP